MVAFRATATGITTTTTNGTTVTITKPTGTINNDTMVAVLSGYNPVTLTAPSGWLLIANTNDAAGLYSWVYQKKAASEGASYVWTWSGAGGALTGSITTFIAGNGIDQITVNVTSTTDPSVGSDIYPIQSAMRYDAYCWQDTTADTITWTIGTETHDINTRDAGTTFRGQSAAYSNNVNAPSVVITANTANPTNTIDYGIHWSMAIAETVTNETWASTGFGTDFNLNSTWTDITSYIRGDAGISISRGTSSEGGQVNPSTATFTLENTDGRFSPKNPTGPYYGSIGRNTPVRVWKAFGTVAMDSTGQLGDRFATPASSAMQITGDMDIRVDCEPETWRQEQTLAAQASLPFAASGGNWDFYIDNKGYLHFAWGTALLVADVSSTLPVPSAVRQTLRATMDVDNGASGNTVTFYTSDSVGGTFTQLGNAVITAGTTTIGNGAYPPLTIGGCGTFPSFLRRVRPYTPSFRGHIYAARLYSGIAGTLVADPDFSAQTTGTYSFQDTEKNYWTAFGSAICSNRRYRFHGEVTSWPQVWDTTGRDVTTPVECSGLLRRAQQNSAPLKSAMYRYYTSGGIYAPAGTSTGDEGPYAPACYWPMEDADGATQFASAVPGIDSMKITGAPTLASYTGFASSDPLPNFITGTSAKGVCTNTSSGAFSVEFLLSAPSGITNGAVIAYIYTTGVDRVFELSYPTTDRLLLRTLDANGTQINTSGNLTTSIAGKLNRIVVSSIGTVAFVSVEEQSSGSRTNIGSCVANATIGRISSVAISPQRLLNNVYIGHLAVFDGDLSPNGASYDGSKGTINTSPVYAYSGEDAATRAQRLIEEQDFTSYNIGSGEGIHNSTNGNRGAVTGTLMGFQVPASFSDNLQSVKDTDAGYIYEPRKVLGLGYRTRQSMYNTASVLTLAYDTGQLSGDLKPEEDDQKTRNDITVTRVGGSSGRYADTTSALGTSLPPTGVGPYTDELSLSLASDDQCLSQAGWHVLLGTVDEVRYPSISVSLENLRILASSTLTASVLLADIGDRIVITGQPTWLPPDQITQQIIGYNEYIDHFQHDITFFTLPESPYQIATSTTAATSATQSKADSISTTLAGTMTTTSTSRTVTIASGSALWITSGVAFDIIVSGERMTVTAVSGSSSPQTFTVTRSVNGVVKTHASGETVSLFKPAITAL